MSEPNKRTFFCLTIVRWEMEPACLTCRLSSIWQPFKISHRHRSSSWHNAKIEFDELRKCSKIISRWRFEFVHLACHRHTCQNSYRGLSFYQIYNFWYLNVDMLPYIMHYCSIGQIRYYDQYFEIRFILYAQQSILTNTNELKYNFCHKQLYFHTSIVYRSDECQHVQWRFLKILNIFIYNIFVPIYICIFPLLILYFFLLLHAHIYI